jgi:predicted Zn-dependent protease
LSIQGKLKQIKIRHKNINIQKALQIYTGKSLEEYCTTVIATIDISQGSHRSWISYCLKSLVKKGEDNTVFKILQNYQQKIQNIESEEGTVWIEIYEALRKKRPEDETICRKYLQMILSYGTNEQKYNLIDETKFWLLKNSENENIVVRHLYLKLVFQSGNQQQQQGAIAQTSIWLKENSSKFKRILSQEQTVRREFIQLLQSFINFAIACSPQTQDNYQILFTIFDLFREFLSKSSYEKLTNLIAEFPLNVSIEYWKQMVNAANIFRDYHNDLEKAERIYLKILNACKTHLKKSSINSQEVNKINNIMRYTQLHYSRLLIQRKPPKTDEAIGYLKELINETPKHGLANLYIAQSYQIKGDTFFRKAREHYQRAINLDIEKTGYFWYEFGRFYLYSIKNVSRAFTCFQESLKQKKNLGACVELADLEVRNQNFSKAKQLLQEGRSLERMTHRDKKQWLDLQLRIQEIESRISKKLDK